MLAVNRESPLLNRFLSLYISSVNELASGRFSVWRVGDQSLIVDYFTFPSQLLDV